jgi:serine/threonine protein kinase
MKKTPLQNVTGSGTRNVPAKKVSSIDNYDVVRT